MTYAALSIHSPIGMARALGRHLTFALANITGGAKPIRMATALCRFLQHTCRILRQIKKFYN
jgi:hypothetical protein